MWEKIRARGLLFLEPCFDLLLLILFSAQAFVAGCLWTYGYVPAPTQWLNETLLEQKIDGFYIQAESFRLKLNGEIELTKLRVYHSDMSDPIMTADSTELQYTLRHQGAYQFTPTRLVLSNGTLQMPAIYSPDGNRATILERVAFHISLGEGMIRVDSFAAQHADIRLRGSIDWPLKALDSTDLPSIERFYKRIAVILKEKEHFSPFIQPTLEFALTARADDSVDVSVHLSCEHLKHTYATGTDFHFQTKFNLQNGVITPLVPLMLRAKAIDVPKFNFAAEQITAHVATDQWKGLMDGIWPEFAISAQSVATHGVELEGSQAMISPVNYPDLQFSGSTNGLKGAVAFEGTLNSATKSGHIQADGSVDIFTFLPTSARTKLPTLEFGSTPHYHLAVTLDDGLKLNSATFRIDVDDLTANGLTFDSIHAAGSYKENLFKLDNILIERGKQWIDATFSQNNITNDFKITLLGSTSPEQYSPLLPKWWPKIFKNIDFSQATYSYGDFVIYGSGVLAPEVFFFGHAAAHRAAYRGALIDQVEFIARGRGNYVELHNINATAGDGWAKGDLSFTSVKKPLKGLLSVRYNFDSLMPLDIASKIFGGTIASIISDFEVSKLPRVKLDGVTFNDAYPQYADNDSYDLDADIDTPITFRETPLDHLQFKLHSRKEAISLRDLEFGYADGNGTARIDIENAPNDGNNLRIDLSLRDANQAKAIKNLPSFDGIEAHLTQSEAQADETIRSKGKLDLNLHVQGPIDNLYAFNGYGDFVTNNEQLGAIQILGPLSSLLKNTRLSFTSFNLDQMTGRFAVEQEMINFSDLIIEGPRTKIWSQGTMRIPDQALNMDVRVKLFENLGNPDSTINNFRKLISSPLPNLLVFNLKGTIHDQEIRLSYDPRNFIPGLK
ncbi:MAG: hypothetical protein ACI9FZ_000919 [Bacteroidia bacterium]|jgi:hypothetical protein